MAMASPMMGEGTVSSRVSRATPQTKASFDDDPRPPEVLTGLPPTVREATAALPAAVGSIDDSRGG